MRRRRPSVAVLAVAAGVPLAAAPAGVAAAQAAASEHAGGAARGAPPAVRTNTGVAEAATRGRITGQIVDAATGEPLAGALVVLVPRPDGVLSAPGADPSGFPAAASRVRSDTAGRYRFAGVAPGTYRLHAVRLGYGAASVDLAVADVAPEVSLGLTVAPLALRPVEVRAAARRTPGGASAAGGVAADAAARLAAAAVRRRTYLTTDARELTGADVAEAVTLGESDVLRALHRLPGVSTRDEDAAELWVRGARPNQTRVTLDGLPLFGPVGAFGRLAAVSADAVGSATLLPGVRPASVGEGSAAVLDLRTRPGGAAGALGSGRTHAAARRPAAVAGAGEVGILSARLALDGASAGGTVGWSIAGRRSYLDAVAPAFGAGPGAFGHFGDLAARADARLSPAQSLIASGLLQRNHTPMPGGVGLAGDGSAAWGNRLLRLTHTAAVGGLRVTHTVGGSAFVFGGRGTTPASSPADRPPSTAGGPVPFPAARASAVLVRGEVAASGPEPTWRAGYEAARQHTRYAGGTQYFRSDAYYAGPAGDGRDSLAVAGRVTLGALWGERRWALGPRLTLEPGLRLEVAGGGAPAVRPSPRLAARYALGASTRLSAAVGRAVQYTQAVPPAGADQFVRHFPGELWLAAGRAAPPLVTDVVTAGVERWAGGGWVASANAYARRARGLATSDPAPGAVGDRAPYVIGREAGRGVELSARRLVGRTTGTLAYSWSASAVAANGYRYAARQDRPHVFDATVARRAGARWRVGAAFSAATGTPYTRTVDRYVSLDAAPPPLENAGQVGGPAYGGRVRDVPNARRNPPFLGASLLAGYARPVGRGQLAAFVQVHSPLAPFTSDAYRGRELCGVPAGTAPGAVFGPAARCVLAAPSQRENALPVLPAAGVRFTF
jgi:hypothetical protein